MLENKREVPSPPSFGRYLIILSVGIMMIGRTDAEAEAPILCPPDAKSQHIGKDPDAGKIEGRRKSGLQRMRCLDDITNSMHMGLSKFWE